MGKKKKIKTAKAAKRIDRRKGSDPKLCSLGRYVSPWYSVGVTGGGELGDYW